MLVGSFADGKPDMDLVARGKSLFGRWLRISEHPSISYFDQIEKACVAELLSDWKSWFSSLKAARKTGSARLGW
jgi:hypothetical protein